LGIFVRALGLDVVALARGGRLGVGGVPHPDHYPAGFRVHDADAGVHRSVPRRALILVWLSLFLFSF